MANKWGVHFPQAATKWLLAGSSRGHRGHSRGKGRGEIIQGLGGPEDESCLFPRKREGTAALSPHVLSLLSSSTVAEAPSCPRAEQLLLLMQLLASRRELSSERGSLRKPVDKAASLQDVTPGS